MSELTEFLLARIAEDEEWAMTSASTSTPGSFTRDNYGALLIQPTRVVAECEAKRRIVALHESWPTLVETPLETETTDDIQGYVIRASKQIAWLTTREYVERFGIDPPTAPILALLALPYADHPDYLPEWKP